MKLSRFECGWKVIECYKKPFESFENSQISPFTVSMKELVSFPRKEGKLIDIIQESQPKGTKRIWVHKKSTPKVCKCSWQHINESKVI